MSDWNRNPDDPRYRDLHSTSGADDPNSMWGWIIGGVLVVLIIGFAIGLGRDDSKVAQINPPPAPSNSQNTPAPTMPPPTPAR